MMFSKKISAALCAGVTTLWPLLANDLANSDFSRSDDGKQAVAWEPYQDGYRYTRQGNRTSGAVVLQRTGENPTKAVGVHQKVEYDQADQRPVSFSGWSKAAGIRNGEIFLHLDITYDDGSHAWDNIASWNNWSHDWEYTEGIFYPDKPVKTIDFYAYFRNSAGTVEIDDLELTRDERSADAQLRPNKLWISSDSPCHPAGIRISAEIGEQSRWHGELLANGKVAAEQQGHGNKVAWHYTGDTAIRPDTLRFSVTSGRRTVTTEYQIPVFDLPVNPIADGCRFWVTGPMDKVFPDSLPPEEPVRQVDIALAREEHEGVQLSFKAADDAVLSPITVTVSELQNADGNIFPAASIARHRVGYVWSPCPSRHPGDLHSMQPSWIPDPLLPYSDITLQNGQTQTVWLDFDASGVEPGIYTGTVDVSIPGEAVQKLPLQLEVYDFALPTTPHFKTAFALMDGFTRLAYGEITPELRKQGLDIMLEHRLNPDDISRTTPPAIEDLLYAKEHGMNAFNIINLVPLPPEGTVWVHAADRSVYNDAFYAELAERLDPYIAELRANGLIDLAYLYGFDERPPEFDEAIKATCKFLKERYPDVKTFSTATYMYDKRRETPTGYQDYMDWYCPLTRGYDAELSAKLRKEGKEVWWYVCCDPVYPYANFAAVDYPAIEGRLLGWMAYQYESDGLLYWLVNDWQNNALIADTTEPFLDWQLGVYWIISGDGTLIYPAEEGLLSSVRLENIRDGQEDYDYLAILAERKGRDAAVKYIKPLIKSLTEYSRDSAQLEQLRRQIAAEIVAAGKEAK
ncbi:DUF4091 domain-containing protein [Victivallis sp. Marseille-Q1083]|uniref:DUF4091 domain-containing protein n=1 Tax=Victivallis sp. Marseille-Q1083 TaxID=2717288 RepID=UPI001589BFA3|nr:DUF4091 domain-containing protein [Victivallis sp. Marseille-Q1083]